MSAFDVNIILNFLTRDKAAALIERVGAGAGD